MGNQPKYGFCVWRPKFEGILYLLAEVCDYNLISDEFEIILKKIRGTNAELDQWADYEFKGSKGDIQLRMAYSEDYPNELVHIALQFPCELKPLIEFVGTIEDLFFSWELETHVKH